MKKIKINRSAVFEAIDNIVEAPLLSQKGISHLDVTGNKEVVVTGCHGVLEYDDDVVCLNLQNHCVRFRGEGLKIRTLLDDEAMITGCIMSIEFTDG